MKANCWTQASIISWQYHCASWLSCSRRSNTGVQAIGECIHIVHWFICDRQTICLIRHVHQLTLMGNIMSTVSLVSNSPPMRQGIWMESTRLAGRVSSTSPSLELIKVRLNTSVHDEASNKKNVIMLKWDEYTHKDQVTVTIITCQHINAYILTVRPGLEVSLYTEG